MSGVVGAGAVKSRLAAFEERLVVRLAEAVAESAHLMQDDLVALVPVFSGRIKEELASPDAIEITNPGTASVRAKVGFLTAAQKRAAFHAFFVEFGTKGYVRGQTRFAGRPRRSGRDRWQKVKVDIPARPAHPFFRPAYLNLKRNLERLRAEAFARAATDALTGKTISDRLIG
jgi:hypothetical protein